MLGNLRDYDGFDPANDAVPFAEMDPLDRWAVNRAYETFERCAKAYTEFEFHLIYHRILELSTVHLSALYFDVIKDTLYIEAADSKLRRSAQTALHMILSGFVRVIAPIMSFTADEIWDRLEGVEEPSVHLAEFLDVSRHRVSKEENAAWERVFELRESVNKVLERERAAQRIGKSLEADIVLTGKWDEATLTAKLGIDLARIFIVSHVDIDHESTESDIEPVVFEGIGSVGIVMKNARGAKCARCWQFREEVTENQEVCVRCDTIIAAATT